MKKSRILHFLFLISLFAELPAEVLPSTKFTVTPLVYIIGFRRIDFRNKDMEWLPYVKLTKTTYRDITSAELAGDSVGTLAATTPLPEGTYDAIRIVFDPRVTVAGAQWDGYYTVWTDIDAVEKSFTNPDTSSEYTLLRASSEKDTKGTTILESRLKNLDTVDAIMPTNTDGKTEVGLTGETIDGEYYYHCVCQFLDDAFIVLEDGSIPDLQINFSTNKKLEFSEDLTFFDPVYVLTVAVPECAVFIDGKQVSP